MNFHFSIEQAIAQLKKETKTRSTLLYRHGSMQLKYYAPQKIDPQTPHRQNELYIIASGSGTFFKNGERVPFKTGDVLFVPAQEEHRFENFTEDFATWVIFYGTKNKDIKQ